jgi:hypothetical protein
MSTCPKVVSAFRTGCLEAPQAACPNIYDSDRRTGASFPTGTGRRKFPALHPFPTGSHGEAPRANPAPPAPAALDARLSSEQPSPVPNAPWTLEECRAMGRKGAAAANARRAALAAQVTAQNPPQANTPPQASPALIIELRHAQAETLAKLRRSRKGQDRASYARALKDLCETIALVTGEGKGRRQPGRVSNRAPLWTRPSSAGPTEGRPPATSGTAPSPAPAPAAADAPHPNG